MKAFSIPATQEAEKLLREGNEQWEKQHDYILKRNKKVKDKASEEVKLTKRAAASLNSKQLEKMTTAQLVQYFREYQYSCNYMFDPAHFKELQKKWGQESTLDICSDLFGTNALTARYFSALEDSLKQQLHSERIFCNPPYNSLIDTFARKIERQLYRHPDKGIEALLLIPYRPSKKYYQDFMKRNRWRIVEWYPANMKLFWKPKERTPYCTQKKRVGSTYEPIVAFKLVKNQNADFWSLQD